MARIPPTPQPLKPLQIQGFFVCTLDLTDSIYRKQTDFDCFSTYDHNSTKLKVLHRQNFRVINIATQNSANEFCHERPGRITVS